MAVLTRPVTGAAALILALGLAACGGGSSSSSSSSTTSSSAASAKKSAKASPAAASAPVATIKNFDYMPHVLTVKAGTSVTWTNRDTTNHTVSLDGGGKDLGNFNPGQKHSWRFTKAGRFTYHCTYHPSMHGTVVVK